MGRFDEAEVANTMVAAYSRAGPGHHRGASSSAACAAGPAHARQYVTVSAVRFWVESEGRGEPLLLIPGGPGLSHNYFHPGFTRLANLFRIIFDDPYVSGRSAHAASPTEYTFERDWLPDQQNAVVRAHAPNGLARWYVLDVEGSAVRQVTPDDFEAGGMAIPGAA